MAESVQPITDKDTYPERNETNSNRGRDQTSVSRSRSDTACSSGLGRGGSQQAGRGSSFGSGRGAARGFGRGAGGAGRGGGRGAGGAGRGGGRGGRGGHEVSRDSFQDEIYDSRRDRGTTGSVSSNQGEVEGRHNVSDVDAPHVVDNDRHESGAVEENSGPNIHRVFVKDLLPLNGYNSIQEFRAKSNNSSIKNNLHGFWKGAIDKFCELNQIDTSDPNFKGSTFVAAVISKRNIKSKRKNVACLDWYDHFELYKNIPATSPYCTPSKNIKR